MPYPVAHRYRLLSYLYALISYCAVILRNDCQHRLRFPLVTNLHDRSLAATAWWLAMRGEDASDRRLRRLVELGADPRAENWLALRMAACAGREDTVRWLSARSQPSAYAIGDAINWARQNGHERTVSALEEIGAISTHQSSRIQ
jgi:hypothetical protein